MGKDKNKKMKVTYSYKVMVLNNNRPQTISEGVTHEQAMTTFNTLKELDATAYVWQYDQRRGLERDPRAKIILSHNW